MSARSQGFYPRLAGTVVFDPIGDQVGRVRDVVVLVRAKGAPRAVGLVVEVPGRRRVFLPLTRVTSIDAGQVISTGLVNLRRFEQRAMESVVLGELLDRRVQLKDGSGEVTIEDVSIAQQRTGDWLVDQLFMRQPFRAGIGAVPTRLDPDGPGRRRAGPHGPVRGAGRRPSAGGVRGHARGRPGGRDPRPGGGAAARDRGRPGPTSASPTCWRSCRRTAQVSSRCPAWTGTARPTCWRPWEPDDAADLLNELPEEQAAQLLNLMEPEELPDVRRLLGVTPRTRRVA